MPTTLFRPVGLHELALIWDLGMREFPPRLPHQPIFYPVINADYARQIARDWNTRDANSGFAGFVAEFAFDNAYIAKFADAYGLKGKTPLPNYRHWQKLGTTALPTWGARFLPTESPYT
jgi:hypothetical protein